MTSTYGNMYVPCVGVYLATLDSLVLEAGSSKDVLVKIGNHV
jgi:hypothetical protein